MKTIDKKTLLAVAISLLVFLSCFPLSGSGVPEVVGEYRFSFGATAGFYYPQQSVFRKIYNKPIWPVELQLGWKLSGKFSVFAASRYLETSGNTVLIAAQRPDASYALRWRMVTIRLGMNYWLWPSRFTPFLGTGVSYSFYQEQWLDVPLETQSQKAGFFVQTGGRYRLSRRWHALAQLEYSFVPAGSGAQGKVNLGGLNLSIGLMGGIF